MLGWMHKDPSTGQLGPPPRFSHASLHPHDRTHLMNAGNSALTASLGICDRNVVTNFRASALSTGCAFTSVAFSSGAMCCTVGERHEVW